MGLLTILIPQLLAFSTYVFFLQSKLAAASFFNDALPPILSPDTENACDGVRCGKGNCTASANETVGYYCRCEDGWKQFAIGNQLHFMPCVVPDCEINYSCQSASPPAATPPSPTNFSFFDPCTWSYCGEGACIRTSTLGHKCQCKTGYSNLLNQTYFPCFSECSLGASCDRLGIGLGNTSSSTTQPSVSDSGNAENQAWLGLSGNWLWWIGIMISLFMVPEA